MEGNLTFKTILSVISVLLLYRQQKIVLQVAEGHLKQLFQKVNKLTDNDDRSTGTEPTISSLLEKIRKFYKLFCEVNYCHSNANVRKELENNTNNFDLDHFYFANNPDFKCASKCVC